MDDDIIDYGPETPNPRANPSNRSDDPEDSLTPLEQEVLDEYAKLVGNLDDVCCSSHSEITGRARWPSRSHGISADLTNS